MSGNGRAIDDAVAARRRANMVTGLRGIRRGPGPSTGADAAGGLDDADERCDLCGIGIPPKHEHLLELNDRRILCAWLPRTFLSTSHRATRRTPLSLRKPSMWSLPRPLKPMTATRMSPFAPAARAHEEAGSASAEAARADDLRNERRVVFIGCLVSVTRTGGSRFQSHFTVFTYSE